MSWEACLMEALEEAEQKGFEAAQAGELAKPEPKSENYEHGHQLLSANQHHEHWMDGWRRGNRTRPA